MFQCSKFFEGIYSFEKFSQTELGFASATKNKMQTYIHLKKLGTLEQD